MQDLTGCILLNDSIVQAIEAGTKHAFTNAYQCYTYNIPMVHNAPLHVLVQKGACKFEIIGLDGTTVQIKCNDKLP